MAKLDKPLEETIQEGIEKGSPAAIRSKWIECPSTRQGEPHPALYRAAYQRALALGTRRSPPTRD